MRALILNRYYKIVCLLLLITVYSCMPESLTKWREDPPSKTGAAYSSVYVDANGDPIPSSHWPTAPTTFQYDSTTYAFPANVAITEFYPTADGSLCGTNCDSSSSTTTTTTDDDSDDYSITNQELSDALQANYYEVAPYTLPYGMTLDASTGGISGTPNENMMTASPWLTMIGMDYLNSDGGQTTLSPISLFFTIQIPPENFQLDQSDKLQLTLTDIKDENLLTIENSTLLQATITATGTCTNSSYSAYEDCVDNVGTCSDSSYTNETDCDENVGTCLNETSYTTKVECEDNQGNCCTTCPATGCDLTGTYTNRISCETASGLSMSWCTTGNWQAGNGWTEDSNAWNPGISTEVATTSYYDSDKKYLYVTRATTDQTQQFRSGASITIGTEANYAKIASVTNIFQISSTSNISISSTIGEGGDPSNGINCTVTPALPSQNLKLEENSGICQITGFASSSSIESDPQYVFVAGNEVGTATATYNVTFAQGHTPPSLGDFTYPKSTDVILKLTNVNNIEDFQVNGTIYNNAATPVQGTIKYIDSNDLYVETVSAGTDTFTVEDHIGTSNSPFVPLASVEKVVNIFETATSDNFLGHGSVQIAPTYTATAPVNNNLGFTICTLPSDNLTFDPTTGVLEGYSPWVTTSTETCQITASNDFGSIDYDYPFIVQEEAGAAPPTGLTYRQSGSGRLKITLDDIQFDIDDFSVGSQIINNNTTTPGWATIDYLDSDNKIILVTINQNYFNPDDLVDINSGSNLYETKKAKITKIINVFEVDSAITSTFGPALVSGADGVTYSITPDLPGNLAFDTTTGIITGTASDLYNATEHTVTARNSAGSTTVTTQISASTRPQYLSYSDQQILTVDTTDYFKAGSYVSSAGSVPSDPNDDNVGIIRRVISDATTGDKLVVDLLRGYFSRYEVIDNIKKFGGAKATITLTPVPSSIRVSVGAFGGTFDVGDIITSSVASSIFGDTSAVITYKDLTNNLYLRVMNGGFYTSSACATTTIISDASPQQSSCISELEARNIAIEAENNQSIFSVGEEVTINDAPNHNSGVVNYVTDGTTNDFIHVTVSRPDATGTVDGVFPTDEELDDVNPYDFYGNNSVLSPVGTMSNNVFVIHHDHLFVLNSGEEITLKSHIHQGNDLKYTVSPDLPDGLTFDTTTGDITGTPTEPYARTLFTVTATNDIASTTSSFYIKINAHFGFSDETNAPSYILHREGEGNTRRTCSINRDQIEIESSDLDAGAPATEVKDVTCFLEAGELDIYMHGLKLKPIVSPGLCDHIRFSPYYFYRFKYKKSDPSIHNYLKVTNNCTAGTPPANQIDNLNYWEYNVTYGDITQYDNKDTLACVGDYSKINSDWPNCDDGKYFLTSRTYTDNSNTPPDDCVYTDTYAETECGGHPSACIGGPIREIFSDAQLEDGVRNLVMAADNGVDDSTEWVFKALSEYAYLSSVGIANFTNVNNCTYGTYRYYNNNWLNYGDVSSMTPDNMYDPFKESSPGYVLECLDAAYDPLARITLYVRDWDRDFDTSSYIYLIDPDASNPDELMDSPDNNDFGDAYNNRADFDDSSMHYTTLPVSGCSSGTPVIGKCIDNTQPTPVCNAGYADDGGLCIDAGETPTSCGGQWIYGVCSNITTGTLTQQECEYNDSNTWTTFSYEFPGGNL